MIFLMVSYYKGHKDKVFKINKIKSSDTFTYICRVKACVFIMLFLIR